MKKVISIILTLSMICSMLAIPVMAENTYAENKLWFDLNGNAELFINTEDESYADRFTMEFLAGVDYSGFLATPTGDFSADKAAILNSGYGGSAMPYTTDKNPSNPTVSTPADFKTGGDGNLYFTFNGDSFRVKPTEKVIKIVSSKIDTSKLTDTEAIKRYSSLNEGITVDVPDGRYLTIGFLTAIRMNYSKSIEVSFKYKENAEAEKVVINTLTYSDTGADLYFKNLTSISDTADWNCQHAFAKVVIEADSLKTLESIHIKDSGAKNVKWPAFIISAWGEGKDVDTLIAELTAIDVTSIQSALNAKAKLEEIDFALANINQTLKEDHQAVYNTKAAEVAVYEKELEAEKEREKLNSVEYKDIPFGRAANSHIFEKHGTTVEGIDAPTSELYTSGTRDYILDFPQDYWYAGNKQ